MRFIQVYVASLFWFLSMTINAQVLFSEQAVALGCGGSTYGDGTLGGGISFFDFDNDGWDDITVTTGSDTPVRFYKNNSGTFSEVTFNITQSSGEYKSAVWVDFDNDGDNDFYITSNIEPNQLFENNGSMQFTDITAAAGLDTPNDRDWGASWGDYNNDGWLDLFQSSRDLNNPTHHNKLFRNNQDGTFTDVTVAAGISTDDYLSFCAAFFDYNNDGWQDIYIADDRPPFPNFLYENNGDGTFTDVSVASGTGIFIDAMSTTIGDDNRDGWFEIYVTNTPAGNVFFRNNQDGTFTDIAAANGTLMETIAWGAVYLDAENDGDLDLYVSSSWTDATTRLTSAFYENDGTGNYTIPTNAGFDNDDAESYGNAIGDIDNDGYPDMVVLNYTPDDIFLWENQCPQDNNWVKVKLEGVTSNRMGIGSVIEISVDGEKQYNYTLCGEGYLSQNSAWEFFGIGPATSIDYIKVTWLSGTEDMLIDPDINTHIVIEEGSTLGIEDVGATSPLQVYPNPASDRVTVKVPASMLGGTLQIVDVQGRVLSNFGFSEVSKEIDTNQYSSGLYFFTYTENGRSYTVKLVVSRD